MADDPARPAHLLADGRGWFGAERADMLVSAAVEAKHTAGSVGLKRFSCRSLCFRSCVRFGSRLRCRPRLHVVALRCDRMLRRPRRCRLGHAPIFVVGNAVGIVQQSSIVYVAAELRNCMGLIQQLPNRGLTSSVAERGKFGLRIAQLGVHAIRVQCDT